MFGALLPVGLPAMLAGALLALSGLRRESPRPWVAPVALGTAYLAGHTAVIGWPPFPPVEATQWLVYATLAAVLCGLVLDRGTRWPWGLRVALVAAVAACALVLWLQPMWKQRWSAAETGWQLAAAGAGCATLGWGLQRGAVRLPPATGWLCATVTGALSALALGVSGSALLAQLAGALTAALAAGAVVARLPGGAALPAVAVPVPLVVLTGLLVCGYHYSEVPALSAALLAVAPLAATALPATFHNRRAAVLRTIIPVVLVLLVGGLALLLAYRSAPPLDLY